jgi:hypothetical protein
MQEIWIFQWDFPIPCVKENAISPKKLVRFNKVVLDYVKDLPIILFANKIQELHEFHELAWHQITKEIHFMITGPNKSMSIYEHLPKF